MQGSAVELPGQFVLRVQEVEALPVHASPSSAHPIGHTADPSVSTSRSQVGESADRLSGTASASANCPYELVVERDSPGARNV